MIKAAAGMDEGIISNSLSKNVILYSKFKSDDV